MSEVKNPFSHLSLDGRFLRSNSNPSSSCIPSSPILFTSTSRVLIPIPILTIITRNFSYNNSNNLLPHNHKKKNNKMDGGGGAGGGGGGGTDVELVCKTLQFEHKLFYFDLKENPRGRYLKISEKTSATRSTIIVPVDGIAWFLDLFNYYCSNDEREVYSKELKLDTKVFYFDIGENKRGRFLKVSEASVSRNRSTIIVPAGSSGDEGWVAFRNILLEINDEATRLFLMPNQQHMEPSERLPGLSDDVGAGFISGNQHVPGSELNVDRIVDLPPQDEIGNMGLSKVIRADQKKFFFDLGSNNRGHFLRISEVAGADRSSIILPLSGLKQFHEILGHFVEITKDRLEGMSGANIRTVEPPQM